MTHKILLFQLDIPNENLCDFFLKRADIRKELPGTTFILSYIKGAYWISSNIAVAILNFSLLLPLKPTLCQLCDSKVVALNPFALIFV